MGVGRGFVVTVCVRWCISGCSRRRYVTNDAHRYNGIFLMFQDVFEGGQDVADNIVSVQSSTHLREGVERVLIGSVARGW